MGGHHQALAPSFVGLDRLGVPRSVVVSSTPVLAPSVQRLLEMAHGDGLREGSFGSAHRGPDPLSQVGSFDAEANAELTYGCTPESLTHG